MKIFEINYKFVFAQRAAVGNFLRERSRLQLEVHCKVTASYKKCVESELIITSKFASSRLEPKMKSIIVAFVLVAAAAAGSVSYVKRTDASLGHYSGHADSYHSGNYEDHHAYPKYKFEYGVKDDHTGDHKSQWEIRDGDVVKGEYTMDEADGTKRVVSYTADDHNGFQAVVKRIGHAHHKTGYNGQQGF